MSTEDLRVLVCGSRDWSNINVIREKIQELHTQSTISEIIEGEARGADTLGRIVADELGITIKPFPAKWNLHGKSAGYRRNIQMLDEGKPHLVLAFSDDILASKGTAHCVREAEKRNIPVRIINSDGDKTHTGLLPGPPSTT